MNNFGVSKWIWHDSSAQPDEYAEFAVDFEFDGKKTELFISADSNYAIYINGKFVNCGQYADYPYDKVYDRIDVTEHCIKGKNRLAIIVWYIGVSSTQVYYLGKAALRFELKTEEKVIAYSSAATPSRISSAYKNHEKKIITNQLGFSFCYDVGKEDGWMNDELNGFSKSFVVEQDLTLRPRPVEKLVFCEAAEAKEIKRFTPCDILFDIGINTVGFLYIETESDEKQMLTVSYGEHIADGKVRRLINGRDFSVCVTVESGESRYMNPFRRLGAKYLEVHSEKPVKIKRIGLVPTEYPITSLPMPSLTKSEREIYEISLRTLRLCMHEHYEDCPWREQALYCMDSRNQMLFGYYAFGEYRFPRACLELISKDNRDDGLLSICFPISRDMVIPSFSLHYFVECAEYLRHSGDVDFIREIYPKLLSVLDVFLDRGARDGNLVDAFCGSCYWNFYEWTDALSDKRFFTAYREGTRLPEPSDEIFEADLILNSLIVIALMNMAEISNVIGVEHSYDEIANSLRNQIKNNFYSSEKNLFADRRINKTYSMLGNSLAILADVADVEQSRTIVEKMLTDSSITPISLSMRCFFYDSLLKVDESYGKFILEDIERIYRPMVELGVGTVWETEAGEADFQNAGSLCHGWSALPIYYYHKLIGKES